LLPSRRLAVGDVIEFTAGEGACKALFKHGRGGFDLDCR
jgi:hypothetical protein